MAFSIYSHELDTHSSTLSLISVKAVALSVAAGCNFGLCSPGHCKSNTWPVFTSLLSESNTLTGVCVIIMFMALILNVVCTNELVSVAFM